MLLKPSIYYFFSLGRFFFKDVKGKSVYRVGHTPVFGNLTHGPVRGKNAIRLKRKYIFKLPCPVFNLQTSSPCTRLRIVLGI